MRAPVNIRREPQPLALAAVWHGVVQLTTRKYPRAARSPPVDPISVCSGLRATDWEVGRKQQR